MTILRAITRIVASTVFATAAQTALADTTGDRDLGKRGGFMVQGDLDVGGDDLVTVSFDNGDSQDIKAGQGIAASVGGYFRPMADSPFELQALIGFKYVTTAASNADINVSRLVVQLNGVYRFANGWYAGAGIVQHNNTELDGDGFFEDIEFDNATGFNIEAGWKWVGLHYTDMEYENDFLLPVDASHIGLRFTARF